MWKQIVSCLCSSVQPVTPNSPLIRFERLEPFPLALSIWMEQADLESYAREQISGAGMRFGPTIAQRLVANLAFLRDQGGWAEMEKHFLKLANLLRTDDKEHIRTEREAAHFVIGLKGIGPKQSRNLWICLGLTRYEIPLDSRVAAWLNEREPNFVIVKRLGRLKYYEGVEDRIQGLCGEAGVFPCEFDAAAFISG